MKKFLSILLVFLMCVAILPVSLFTAFAEPTQSTRTTALDLTQQGTTDSLLSTEGWAWDADTKTLTLNGLNLSVTDESAITAPDGTTVVLAAGSENTIVTNHTKGYGISVQGSLTIKSADEKNQGTLNITATNYGIRYIKAVGTTYIKFDFSNIILNITAVRGVVMNTDSPIENTSCTIKGATFNFTDCGREGTIRSFQVWPSVGNATLTVENSSVNGDGGILVNGENGKMIVDNSIVSATSSVYVQQGKTNTMQIVNNSTLVTTADLMVGGDGNLAELTVKDSSLTTGSKWSNDENASIQVGNGLAAAVVVTVERSKVVAIDGIGIALELKPTNGGTLTQSISDSTFFLAGKNGLAGMDSIPADNEVTTVSHGGRAQGAQLATDSDGNKTLMLPKDTKITSGGKTYTVGDDGATITYDAKTGCMRVSANAVLTVDGTTVVSNGTLSFATGAAPVMPANITTTVTTSNDVEIVLTPTMSGADLSIDSNGDIDVPVGTTVKIGDSEPVELPAGGTIDSAGKFVANPNPFEEINLSLGVDISVNYYVSSEYKNAKMRFTINEYTMTVDGELADEQRKFVFTGVAPQWIGDNIKAELIVDDEVVAIKNYSVLEYLNALKAKTAETLEYTEEKHNAMVALVDSLLVYGGTAQTYKNHNTDKIVSNVVPTAVSNITTNKTCANGDVVTFTGATVYFNNTIRLMFRFTASDINGLTFELDGKAVNYVKSGDYYVITTDAIKATDFGHGYELKAYVNGVKNATLTYSVNSYAYSMQSSSNANMKALATALYNYGVAAEAYVTAQ